MSDLHDLLPPPGRTNATWLHDLHPENHNALVDAVNQLAARLPEVWDNIHLVVYADDGVRDGDTGQGDGTLAWTVTEGTLAIAEGGAWTVLLSRMQTFDPRAWIGDDELTLVPVDGYVSRYRQEFGVCWFLVHARFSGLDDGLAGTLSVLPPLTPDVDAGGPFQMAYAVVPTLGAIGGMRGAYNGTTTLAGAPAAGQLAFVMPGIGGLMQRTDMGPDPTVEIIAGGAPGEFDLSLAGFFPIEGFF